MLLRESDLREGGSEEIFYHWDLNTGQAVVAPGSMGSQQKTIRLNGVNPALEGEFEVQGVKVTTVFENVREEAMKFSPEAMAEVTGVAAGDVRAETRAMAKAKKAIMALGFNVGRYSNGIYTGWATALALALTGHGGKTGGMDTSWVEWNHPKWLELCFVGFTKFPRFEAGGLGEFQRGGMIEHARKHFDPVKMKDRIGYDVDEMEEMINESLGNGWMPYYGDMKGLISIADNKFRRNKFADKYRERILHEVEGLFVDINVRMDSTAQWADYLLPAASHYEAWDMRSTGMHRFVNVFSRPVAPIGEAKPDWDIMALLTKKIQERAIARGIGSFQDGEVTRDLHTIHDDFTMGGAVNTDYDATKWIADNSPELNHTPFAVAAERGFFVMNQKGAFKDGLHPSEPYHPFLPQTEKKQPYDTLTGRISFCIDHPRFIKLGAKNPTAKHHAGAEASNYPLNFYSPHTRWGIHSNWRSNKFMMRLQRGEPDLPPPRLPHS